MLTILSRAISIVIIRGHILQEFLFLGVINAQIKKIEDC